MKKILRYFRDFYRQCGGLVLGYLALTIVHKTLAFVSPPALQRLIDAVIGGDRGEFLRMLVANAGIAVAFVIALYWRNYHGERTESRVTAYAEQRVFSDMLRMPYRELKKNLLGHYLHLIDRDVDQITGLAFYDLSVFVLNIVMTAAMLVYLLQCDWVLSMVVLAVLPLFVVLTKLQLPKMKQCQEQVIAKQEDLNDKIDECYNGNESIRSSNAEAFFMKRFEQSIAQWLRVKREYIFRDCTYDMLSITGLMNLANIAIYCIGGWRALNGKISVGTIMTFTMYFSTLWNSIEGFMIFFKEYRMKQISLSRLDEMHALCEEPRAAQPLPPFEKLSCQQIGFAYAEKPVFSDFSMVVNKGERILLTGENGSGKSTVARLLTGLMSPDQGAIYYNDQRIDGIDAAALREKVLLIPTEPFIIEGTVEENLWGRESGQPMDRLAIDRPIEKNGGNLSNGQKKQLQLYRSLAANAEVVIFDEPFNFIDRESKEMLWNEILQTFSDRTLIVISHDPFPSKDCHRIVHLGAREESRAG